MRRDISRGVAPVGRDLIAVHWATAIRIAVATWFPVATGFAVATRRPVVSGCRGALPRCDAVATALGVATVPEGASGFGLLVRVCLADNPVEGLCVLLACWACRGYKPAVRCGFVVLPHLFARCLAVEGLSRSEVVSVSWDLRPREPFEGVLQATSVLELAAHTRQSLVSLPLSALVPEPRSGVRREAAAWPGCGVACVVCSVAALSRPCAGAEAGARLASKACGLRVPLLDASGGGLVAVVVTTFSSRRFQVFLVARACTAVIARLCLVSVGVVGLVSLARASGGSRFGVLSVPWSRSWVSACDGTGVCGSPTWWRVHGLGWFCL
ncbi:hypothetical protein Taro_042268 [Colocasia esculenta]|uniref:Uncharacterized protein n=1 Tax=Colocasia esculenta TaxID=4460 RepID=A0A843WHZ7_COLES|nr:hypothetical protein [Colocasia esculenta]